MGAGASTASIREHIDGDWARDLHNNIANVEVDNLGDDARLSILTDLDKLRTALAPGGGVSCNLVIDKSQLHATHHTDGYDDLGLALVRRGQDIAFEVQFDKNVQFEGLNKVWLDGITSKAKVAISISDDEDVGSPDDSWSCRAEILGPKAVRVNMMCPPDAAIGAFKLNLSVTVAGVAKKLRCEAPEPLAVLFNPWCEEDQVFMAEAEMRCEYVEAEDGAIYVGASDWPSARPWAFSQFGASALPAVLKLMEGWPLRKRADPVLVCRGLSAMVNSPDDGGVLVGNWSGDYSGGTKPTAWTGSEAILAEYLKTGRPVQFGQCWVFSGVLTTILRAIGIPARSVTNFDSAHDTTLDRMVDKFFTRDAASGELQPNGPLTSDSIWNFHVWNDAWMRRPDLPPGRGGWQAVDATPQETSDGRYQCGPASLAAVKAGERSAYDNDFLIGEVNADVRYWEVDAAGGNPRLIRVQRDRVGTAILTKAVGQMEKHNITNLYKHPEGSLGERAALLRYDRELPTDDVVTISVQAIGLPEVGKPFGIKITSLAKQGAPQRDIDSKLKIIASRAGYTGAMPAETLKQVSHIITSGKEGVEVMLHPEDYGSKLNDSSFIFEFTVLGDVQGFNQTFMETKYIILQAPILTLVFEDRFSEVNNNPDSRVVCSVSFTNPLNLDLTNGVLTVEGRGLLPPTSYSVGTVAAGGSVMLQQIEINAWKAGTYQLIAELDTDQMTDIIGSISVTVKQGGEVGASS